MDDRARWNAKHGAAGGHAQPSPLLAASAPGLPPGMVLDVACGRGANALMLARLGHDVLAVDVSDVALEWLREAAAHAGLSDRVRVERRDVLADGLPEGEFDLVVVTRFLERAIWPALRQAVRPGGRVFFETFTIAHHERTGGRFRLDWCLRPGELLDAFTGFEVLLHRVDEAAATESLLARRPLDAQRALEDERLARFPD